MRASSSSGSSKLTVSYLNTVTEKLKANQNRSSTAKNYHAIWRIFNKFLIKLEGDIKHLCWEERTILFGSHMVDSGAQSQTIASYFSAIKHILKCDGYAWDSSKAQLSVITRSCRILNDSLKIRLPIRIKLLELILFEVERHFRKHNQWYLETMYKTAFLLAYYGMMRVGELTMSPHTAKAKDVSVGSNKDKIMITLFSSKTHGRESKPQHIKITSVENLKNSKNDRFFCPFKIARQYFALRGNYLHDNEVFLIFRDRQPVKPSHFRSTLKLMIKKLNLDPDLYNTHSLRAGRSNDMKNFGYSLTEIRKAGRWRVPGAVSRYLEA